MTTPYLETRTQFTAELPSLHAALAFIDDQPEDQVTDVRLRPTVNDPGKWTVSVHLYIDNLEEREREGT